MIAWRKFGKRFTRRNIRDKSYWTAVTVTPQSLIETHSISHKILWREQLYTTTTKKNPNAQCTLSTHTTHKTHIRQNPTIVFAYTFFFSTMNKHPILSHIFGYKKFKIKIKPLIPSHSTPPCVPINHSLFKHNGNATRWFNLFWMSFDLTADFVHFHSLSTS